MERVLSRFKEMLNLKEWREVSSHSVMVDFTPTCAALSAYAAEANAMHTCMKLVGTDSAVQSASSFSIIIVKRRLYSLESHLALNRIASSFPSLVPLCSCLCSHCAFLAYLIVASTFMQD
jgi:hypothetical protein